MALAVIRPDRLVVLTAAPQVAVAVVETQRASILHKRLLGCPALELGPAESK